MTEFSRPFGHGSIRRKTRIAQGAENGVICGQKLANKCSLRGVSVAMVLKQTDVSVYPLNRRYEKRQGWFTRHLWSPHSYVSETVKSALRFHYGADLHTM